MQSHCLNETWILYSDFFLCYSASCGQSRRSHPALAPAGRGATTQTDDPAWIALKPGSEVNMDSVGLLSGAGLSEGRSLLTMRKP